MLEPVTGTEKVFHVDLEGDLTEVVENLGLGLLPDEIEKVRKHFLEENRKPTDVELQAISGMVRTLLLQIFEVHIGRDRFRTRIQQEGNRSRRCRNHGIR